MNKFNSKQRGVGLVEVMIAIIIVAVGILGIAKLQINVVRSGVDANNRAVAAIIAQNKIDDLRSYARLDNASRQNVVSLNNLNRHTYEDIGNNTGGEFAQGSSTTLRIPSGVVDSAALNLPTNTNFTLSWALVDDYYYVNPLVPASTAAPTLPTLPSYKLLAVTVTWNDIEGNQQTHVLKTIIDGYSPTFTSQFGSANYGSVAPIVPYTPEAAPDVVPVTLDADDGLKKETSKPLPDVSKKGFSVATSFESVSYNLDLDTVRREDFLTLSCRCGTGTANNIHLLGRTVWDEQNLKLRDEVNLVDADHPDAYSVTQSVVNDGGGEAQAPECSICCRDAEDTVQAADNGYYKSCRLKRVNGVMRLFEPWKLIAFNIIPASYFDDDGIAGMDAATSQENIDSYSDYVTDLVRVRLVLSEAAFAAESADSSFAPNNFQNNSIDHLSFTAGGISRQIQARAVYMDYPPTGIYDECGSGPCDESDVPLDRVSFVEVNVTNLAGWMPDRTEPPESDYMLVSSGFDYTQQHDAIDNGCDTNEGVPSRAFVTNDELVNGCEGNLDFSRGLFEPGSVAASTALQTIIFESNDGLVNRATTGENTVSTELELITD